MGAIIRLNSKKFIHDFLKEFDPNKFQFLLISENITTKGEYSNVYSLPALIPPPYITSVFINEGFSKAYKKGYLEYLQKPEVKSLITIMIQTVVIHDMNLVLLCSMSEDEFQYLDMICEFIEAEYKLNTYTYKKYQKDPEKASKIKNKDEVTQILMKAIDKLHDSGVDLNPKINKNKLEKKLGKMDKGDLKKYCKQRGIKFDDDTSKKKLIKKIIKKVM